MHSQFIFKTGTSDEKLSNCGRFASQMQKAALEIFDEKHVVQNRDYLSRYTWHLINQRQIARQRRDTQAEQVLNREIKKSAKRDKIQWRISKLEDLTDIKNSWKHIKYETREYTPKFYDIKDIRGNRVPQVCCIYKKGAHDNPENYRPISLLNTSYKIFASIIQSRLANILEPLLGDTQHGFRPKRSTAEPLFCVRRLADFAEQGNDPLFLIFLDWGKNLR